MPPDDLAGADAADANDGFIERLAAPVFVDAGCSEDGVDAIFGAGEESSSDPSSSS